MNREALGKKVGELVDAVRTDSRWQQDDLSVTILGMISYGYALALGRLVRFLDMPHIDAAVHKCLTDNLEPRQSGAAGWLQTRTHQLSTKPISPAIMT
jgi:hypothetical protein